MTAENPEVKSALSDDDWLVEAIESVIGHVPRLDEDDDFVVPVPDGLVYVRELAHDGIVLFHSPVVFNISETEKIGYVVHLLNEAHPDLKFRSYGSGIGASARLYVDVPVPQHVARVLVAFSDLMANGIEIAGSLSGDFAWADDSDEETRDPTDDALPEPIQVLVQLDGEGRGTLTPEQVATICDHDRDAVLRYLTIVSMQKIEWSKSADEALASGDAEEAAACEHEANAWQVTHDSLRDALRFIVLGA